MTTDQLKLPPSMCVFVDDHPGHLKAAAEAGMTTVKVKVGGEALRTVGAFRLATSGVADSTQIHTHLCYSEFGEVIDQVEANVGQPHHVMHVGHGREALRAQADPVEAGRAELVLTDAVRARPAKPDPLRGLARLDQHAVEVEQDRGDGAHYSVEARASAPSRTRSATR